MNNISVPDRDQVRGIERLSSACNRLLQQRTSGPSWPCEQDEEAFNLLFGLAKGMEQDRLVPVYRKHQPTTWSPCLLGNPCEVCEAHRECARPENACRRCFRGKRPECLRAEPAPPAFTVTKTAAVKMVRLGLAQFVNRQRALQLTFSRLTELRGVSMRVDETVLIAYASQESWARSIIDLGWFPTSHLVGIQIPVENYPAFHL